jgi:hypothetical protein
MEFVASLIAVVSLAEQVISCCCHYISAVKDCPSDLRSILIETSSLKSVVENLEFLYKNSPNPALKEHFLRLSGDDGPIGGCRKCLQELEKLLPIDKSRTTNGKKQKTQHPTLERLAWPLRETKARKLLGELGRFRGVISLALVVDALYAAI